MATSTNRKETTPDLVSTLQKEIHVGPWGGTGGDNWEFKPKGMTKQIDIMVYNEVIRSLTFISMNEDGTMEAPIKIGKDGGTNVGQVIINSPLEYLKGVSGTIGNYKEMVVISSLKFHTNMTEYGPYGTNSGTPFSFVMQDGEIVGFQGRAGWYVDAIGAYIISKEIHVGPWGGIGGDNWDFKPKGMIKQIDIMVYNEVIRSLTFTSMNVDGTMDAPIKVGKDGGTIAGQVTINAPLEYLMGVSGTIGNYKEMVVLSSLKFHTNVAEYGPYGINSGTSFSFVIQDGKIVGFHGHAGWYVDAIGAYIISN